LVTYIELAARPFLSQNALYIMLIALLPSQVVRPPVTSRGSRAVNKNNVARRLLHRYIPFKRVKGIYLWFATSAGHSRLTNHKRYVRSIGRKHGGSNIIQNLHFIVLYYYYYFLKNNLYPW